MERNLFKGERYRYNMKTTEIFQIPWCKRCGTKAVYTRVDGSVVCKRCGYIQKKENQK